ncbi:MAG: hypothetical protein P4N59_16500 [Negativicutes bacterium]|nr:hypothetical protein [Negativicutes bacterium]
MPKNVYSVGDLIYLAKSENGAVIIQAMQLVLLVSICADGELWKVSAPDSGDFSEHFIRYAEDEAETEAEKIVKN